MGGRAPGRSEAEKAFMAVEVLAMGEAVKAAAEPMRERRASLNIVKSVWVFVAVCSEMNL
jgi:hypothetical protein